MIGTTCAPGTTRLVIAFQPGSTFTGEGGLWVSQHINIFGVGVARMTRLNTHDTPYMHARDAPQRNSTELCCPTN